DLCTRAWGDIFGRRCRLSRARRATCNGWDVAPHADPERHACPGMSLRTRAKCDIDRIEVSLEPSIKATFTLLLGVPRACEVRHAAATSGARTRETAPRTRSRRWPMRCSPFAPIWPSRYSTWAGRRPSRPGYYDRSCDAGPLSVS